MGTFRHGDFISSEQGIMIKNLIITICSDLKKHIIPIVESFYPDENMIDSMIAPSNGDLYGSIVNKVFTAPQVFERSQNW